MKSVHWSFGACFAALRMYTGLFGLAHGIPKFLFSNTFMPPGGAVSQLVGNAIQRQSGFYHDFLANAVLPNIGIFSELVRLGEVLTGCSLVLGIFTRVGGLAGCFLALNYMAAQGELHAWKTIGSLDAAAFALSFMMLVSPAGRIAGIDGILAAKGQKPAIVVPEFVDEPPLGPRGV
jgi:hypothetical protein